MRVRERILETRRRSLEYFSFPFLSFFFSFSLSLLGAPLQRRQMMWVPRGAVTSLVPVAYGSYCLHDRFLSLSLSLSLSLRPSPPILDISSFLAAISLFLAFRACERHLSSQLSLASVISFAREHRVATIRTGWDLLACLHDHRLSNNKFESKLKFLYLSRSNFWH